MLTCNDGETAKRSLGRRSKSLIAGVLLSLTTPFASDVQAAPASDGGEVAYQDGCYHYRAPDGLGMISMWVPPDAKPVRGAFINGNPGGYGENRKFTRDRTFRAFAARHDFALIGLAGMPGNQMQKRLGKDILGALNDFAAMGHHPELSNIPLITLGNSNGGSTSYNLSQFVPERIVCFAMNVGSMNSPPSDAMLEVPGIIVIGPKDPLVGARNPADQPQYVARVRDLVEKARQRGARWAWVAEQNKGHEVGRIFDYYMMFFDHCIRARLPSLDSPDGDPRKGPVKLKQIELASGWLCDDRQWESGLTPVAGYADYPGDKSVGSWVPDKDLAYLYRGLATYNNPVTLRFSNLVPIENLKASGVYLTEVGGHLLEPSDEVTVEADLSAFPKWSRIEFYNGANLVGQHRRADLKPDEKPSLTLNAPADTAVCSFTVLAYDEDGNVRTATPLHFVVRDPNRRLGLDSKPLAPGPVAGPAARTGAAPTTQPFTAPTADAAHSTLVTYALTAEQEQQYVGRDGKLAPFWALLDDRHDRLVLNPASNAPLSRDGAAPQAQFPQMIVRAARGSAGLYLYFEVRDDDWANASPEAFRLSDDVLDFILDRQSADQLWNSPTATAFTHANACLGRTAVQFQTPFGSTQPPTLLRYSFSDPFEFRQHETSRDELQKARGIVVSVTAVTPNSKAQEWFIPWAEVGLGGLQTPPEAGQRLLFSVGYNNRNTGSDAEKAPTAQGVVKLRWLQRSDPWGVDWRKGRNGVWGELLMGPPIQ